MPKKKPKHPGGRPTKATPQILEKSIALANKGKSVEQIAEVIGICPKTLHNWAGSRPEFLQALREARQNVVELVAASIVQRALGYTHVEEKIFMTRRGVKRVDSVKHYPPDVAAAIFYLRNRDPKNWPNSHVISEAAPAAASGAVKATFEDFCAKASYPPPYNKQLRMREFAFDEHGARLLLGARGYGKTDYVTIMGVAYAIYCDWFDFHNQKPGENKRLQDTTLLVTKSEERNAAILVEISSACRANGVEFEKENATCLRVKGLRGKDHSVSSITVGTSSVRGRHPKRVIMDDPVTPEDVSKATRKRVQRLYNELTKLCKDIVLIGQPVHKWDLYESLRPILKKMEFIHGEIPELDHDLEAQRLAGVSEESIQASYFLKVLSESSSPFEKVNYLDAFPPGDSVAFIDPSFKGVDYTALSIVKAHFDGVAVQGHVYKKAWNHCIDEMVYAMRKSGVRKLCIECNSLGDQPVALLRDALKNSGIGVVGKDSTANKHSRIMAAGVFAHLIHLSRTSDRAYTDQVVKYEYGAENDDAPDSLASALEWIGLIRGKNKA